MKIEACIDTLGLSELPDPLDDVWGPSVPLDHVICRESDGTPHFVREFIWPWTAYTGHESPLSLRFHYWKSPKGRVHPKERDLTPQRQARMRELQFLMTRQIYFGQENAPRTLYSKLDCLRHLARFAEARSISIKDVLTDSSLLDTFGDRVPGHVLESWRIWLAFLSQLDPDKALGFQIAAPRRAKALAKRAREDRSKRRQIAPLPTRVYASLIANLSKELDDIDDHKERLLTALREVVDAYRDGSAATSKSIGEHVIARNGLTAFLERRGYSSRSVYSLSSVVREIFRVCKLQVHLFSGMRDNEVRHLPYHCMVVERGRHGRTHCVIVGVTTKLNKGRRLRTQWVTTEHDGFRAIRLAREFADVLYEVADVRPLRTEKKRDKFPLFPSTSHFPWFGLRSRNGHLSSQGLDLTDSSEQFLSRLCPLITSDDLAELEQIDPFRAWRDEPSFAIGRPWPLTTHQLRRSLAIYANSSGLVRLSSLRRQLQHISREMSLYYGRGSIYCRNFLASDPASYRKHIAVDWQDGQEEAEMLAFVRDVLNSNEPLFGGAGTFYDRQRQRGDVMTRTEVRKQMKAGLLAYRESPLGGCTRPGECVVRKGLNLIETVCATDGCKHLVGKHSKIVQSIRLKRAAMAHIAPHSITASFEQEDLHALERVEQEWRPRELAVSGA